MSIVGFCRQVELLSAVTRQSPYSSTLIICQTDRIAEELVRILAERIMCVPVLVTSYKQTIPERPNLVLTTDEFLDSGGNKLLKGFGLIIWYDQPLNLEKHHRPVPLLGVYHWYGQRVTRFNVDDETEPARTAIQGWNWKFWKK